MINCSTAPRLTKSARDLRRAALPRLRRATVSAAGGALLGLLLTLAGSAWAQAPRVVRLSGDPWPPFVEGELGREASGGLVVELIRKVFERIDGVEPGFPILPWKRALQQVRDGEMDGISGPLKSPERETYMAYSVPLFEGRALVWYSSQFLDGGFEWSDMNDLRPYRIAVVRGYSYGAEIDRLIEAQELDLVFLRSVENSFAMLARGRVDLALATEAVGYAQARRISPPGIIRAAARPTGIEVYHLALSRKSRALELLPRIDAAIEALRREGVIDRIVRGAGK